MSLQDIGKYKEGEKVYSKVNPSVELIVRRYLARIYYCRVASDQSLKEEVYFERELMGKMDTA